MKSITDDYNLRHHAENPRFNITARKVGYVVRKTLGLSATKGKSGFSVNNSPENKAKLEDSARKYGLEFDPQP